MATPTTFFAFGFSGIDQEVNQHIQTNLVFAIADAKREWMAWYIYFQRLLLGRWEDEFIAAGNANLALGAKYDRSKDKRITLFAMAKSLRERRFEADEVSSFARFADNKLEIDGHVGTPATLSLFDVGRTTKCIIFIDTGKKGTMFDFDLDKVADRRGFDHRGGGTVLRLGVDRFNQSKLIGPAGGPPKKTEIGDDPAHTLF
jgi:hypothetical protein